MSPKIIVHCLVRNEERFIWYALQAVLPFADQILVWDTGSNDKTVDLIKLIKSPKIKFKQLNPVSAVQHTQTRDEMLKETDNKKFDWLMILDGDEIWPNSQLKTILEFIKKNHKAKAIVVRTRNFLGDIYHLSPENAGRYNLAGKTGHLNLRFISLKLPELSVVNPHGGQTHTTQGIPIQNLPFPQLQFCDAYYYHATHLPRSSQDQNTLKRSFKRKYEIGKKITKEELPEILFSSHPKEIPDVTSKMSTSLYLLNLLLTLPRYLKRHLLPVKHGY